VGAASKIEALQSRENKSENEPCSGDGVRRVNMIEELKRKDEMSLARAASGPLQQWNYQQWQHRQYRGSGSS